jgi:hypothetical protein
LGRWYAEPLAPAQAERQLQTAGTRLEKRLRHGGNTLCCRLLQMQARFWLEKPIAEHYQALRYQAERSAHGCALVELIYGQLLTSRLQIGALEHLNEGFSLARALFSPQDYFRVLERHRLLQHLPFREEPAAAQSLQQLLMTAQVIERLTKPDSKRPDYRHDKHDTYG